MSKTPYIAVEKDGTCWSDEVLACPNCRHSQTDLFEIPGAYTEDGGETNCQNCNEPFTFSTFIGYSWTSRKPREGNGK